MGLRVFRFFLLIILFIPFLNLEAGIKKERRAQTVASSVNGIGLVPTIVIDAGHGGVNLGAHIRNPFFEEKRFTLLTARLIKKYLSQLGYRVVMTRTTDTFVPLPKRVEIANQSHGDLFISIHFNSSKSPMPHGVEVFFCDTDHQRTTLSRKLASSILSRVIRRTKATSRGVKKASFLVIRETQMPAVLVEGGFISNPHEMALLKDPEYIERIARGVVEGIDHYFKR